MRQILLSCIGLLLLGQSAAQTYSYLEDRRFVSPEVLIGYDFVPSEMDIPSTEEKRSLRPGDYSFGVSYNYLYVDGGDIKGVYSYTTINPTEYGYRLDLMNARDPTIQGHLKIILNPYANVEALIFKKTNKSPEIVFLLPEKSPQQGRSDQAYFTDRWEMPIAHPDSLWGKQVRPMLRVGETQQRLLPADSTYMLFTESVRISDKRKAKPGETLSNLDALSRDELLAYAATDKKVKVEVLQVLRLRTRYKGQDGKVEDVVREFPIRDVKERVDDSAGEDGEKYQWVLKVDELKDGEIYLYFTAQRSLSAIEIGPELYLMQGH